MPKMKTRRAAAKRFRVTGTGKVARHKAWKSHLLTHKSRKRKRHLKKGALVHETQQKQAKRLIPYL